MLLGCNTVAEAATFLSSLLGQHRSPYTECLGAVGAPKSSRVSENLSSRSRVDLQLQGTASECHRDVRHLYCYWN